MLNTISQEALEFLEEAKKAFNSNYKMVTYRNKDDEFIALRNGFSETVIDIYKIEEPVGRFTDQLPSQYTEAVLSDDLSNLKKSQEVVNNLKKITDYYHDKYNDSLVAKDILSSLYTELGKVKFEEVK